VVRRKGLSVGVAPDDRIEDEVTSHGALSAEDGSSYPGV
jgi:hypothetical protein